MSVLMKRNIYIVSILFLYSLTLLLQLQVPIISDDFSYITKGGSIEALISHYNSWSGRVVADTLSSNALYFLPHYFYSALNTTILFILIILISIFPYNLYGHYNFNKISITFIYIFLLYWVSNPNLGQTTFWIVGSANYLWTTCILFMYINILIFLSKSEKPSILSISILSSIGLLSGWTNEGSGWVAAAFTFFYILYKRKILYLYLPPIITSTIGYLSLIFAPGNFVRSNKDSFIIFNNKSWIEKFELHFIHRVPGNISDFWQVFLALSVFFLVLFLYRKRSPIKDITFPILFFISSFLLSIFILVAAPVYGGRGLNPSFCFLLMALSSLIFQVFKINNVKYYSIYILLIFLLFNFFYSYFFMYRSYNMLKNQNNFRVSIIEKTKDQKKPKKNIDIPEFHNRVEWINKKTDNYDFFTNLSMAGYYDLERINTYDVGFDYSALDHPAYRIDINEEITHNLNIEKVYIYYHYTKPIFKKRYYAIFQMDNNPTEIIPRDKGIYVFGLDDSMQKLYDTSMIKNKIVKIDEKYYIGMDLNIDFEPIKLNSISTGLSSRAPQ